MENYLSKAQNLFNLIKYDEVPEFLDKNQEEMNIPELFVLKEICIKLSSAENKYELAIDNKHVEAWLELGWFHMNVEDDADNGIKFFQEAIQIISEKITESAIVVRK